MPFPGLSERVREVRDRIQAAVDRGGHGQTVELIAVTKTYGPEAVEAIWETGVQAVGENRVQEALEKMDQVRAPVAWHLIGHLQRNKARHAGRFELVHSVDSVRLARALSEEGMARGSPIRVLLQVNASGEASKSGFAADELDGVVEGLAALGGIRIEGVMTMAPFEAGEQVLRSTFAGARREREVLQAAGFPALELSMGMSGDFEVAIEEGATMVRLGTILFGARG